jgi:hypothetical protein
MAQNNKDLIDMVEDFHPEAKVVAYRGIASAALTRAIFAVNALIEYDKLPDEVEPTLDARNELDHQQEADQRADAPVGLDSRETVLARALRWTRLYKMAADRNMQLAADDIYVQADTIRRRAEFLAEATPQTQETVDILGITDPTLRARIAEKAKQLAAPQQAKLADNIDAIEQWIDGIDIPETIDFNLFEKPEVSAIASKGFNELVSRLVWLATRRNMIGSALLVKSNMEDYQQWMTGHAKSA